MAVMESDAVRTKANTALLSCLSDWSRRQEQAADQSPDWSQMRPHAMRANLAHQLAYLLEQRGPLYALGWLGGRLTVTFGLENDGWQDLANLVRTQAWPTPGEPAFGEASTSGDESSSSGANGSGRTDALGGV
jgi:hypothetical protein